MSVLFECTAPEDRALPQREELWAWMSEHGVEPHETRSIQVCLLDAPYMIAICYTGEIASDESGAWMCLRERLVPVRWLPEWMRVDGQATGS